MNTVGTLVGRVRRNTMGIACDGRNLIVTRDSFPSLFILIEALQRVWVTFPTTDERWEIDLETRSFQCRVGGRTGRVIFRDVVRDEFLRLFQDIQNAEVAPAIATTQLTLYIVFANQGT